MRIIFLILFAILILMLIMLSLYLLIGNSYYRKFFVKFKKLDKEIKVEERDDFYKNFEKLTLESFDNLKLNGYYKDNNSERLVILVHGLTNSAYDMIDYANIFLSRGYDILSIDMRAHGKSEGREITLGKNESNDLVAWIKLMVDKKPRYKIVLFGISMGASTVCLTIGKEIDNNVVLAISDCGYDNADKELKYLFSKQKILPGLMYKIFYNYVKKSREIDLKKIDPFSSLKNNKLPVLFIHGDKDEVVPVEMVYNLSSQVPDPRRNLLIVKDAGHCGSYKTDRQLYLSTVNQFLQKYNM